MAGASGEVLSELIGVAGEEQLVAMARTKRRLTANARSRMPRGCIVVSFAQLAGRMLQADDNTLWIGMTKCDQGERINNNQPYGCLTMYNTSSGKVTQRG